jgi:PAS domain S-box-containing protein
MISSTLAEPGTGKLAQDSFEPAELRRIQELLVTSEARYRSYLELTGQLGWTTNAAGEVVAEMPTWQRFTGQTTAEVQGWAWSAALHPEDREQAVQCWRQAIATKKQYETEYRVRRHDGVYRSFLARGIPAFDSDGEVLEWVGTCVDITERKRAEERLRESESFYRQTLESIPGMVFTTRPDGHCDYRSRQWVEFTGVPMSEHLGDGWNKLLHSEDQPRAHAAWKAAVEGRRPYDLECRVRRHDGVYEWFKIIGRPICDTAGRIVRWFGVALNIEALKHVEANLRQSQIDLDRAQEIGQIGGWRLDICRNVLTWSDENHRIFGVPKGTPLNYETFLGIVHPDDREYVDTRWQACLRGEPYDLEHRIVVGGQVKWVREKAYLEFDDKKTLLGGFGISKDITERKATEERLKASLYEKDVFLKEIHHRVKNNLQVISSLADLHAEGLRDPTVREALGDVRDRVRCMALVHEKLYQSESLAEVQFAVYARSLLNYLWRAHGLAAARIQLHLDLQPVPLSVDKAVPCGLILNELAANALKHAFPGRDDGLVTVSLRNIDPERICLLVHDDGVGLPAGFDWRQAKTLGLRLVQMLAGQIEGTLEARVSQGTEFELTFETGRL